MGEIGGVVVFYGVAESTVHGDISRSGGVRGYTVQITRERFKPTTSDVFPSADPFDRLMERKIEHAEKNVYIYIIHIPIDEISRRKRDATAATTYPSPAARILVLFFFSSNFLYLRLEGSKLIKQ